MVIWNIVGYYENIVDNIILYENIVLEYRR